MDGTIEKRRSTRKITNLPVSLRIGNTMISSYTHDLSLQGMFLETDVLLDRKEEFPLALGPRGALAECDGFGRVVYLNPGKDEPGRIKSRGMGIELLDLPGKNAGVLRRHLAGIPEVGSPSSLSGVKVRSREELEEFIQLPFRLHREDPCWIPPLVKELRAQLTEDNPFLQHGEMDLYLVKNGPETVGRIAAVIDHDFCGRYGEQVGYFGFFESIPDFQVASRLFDLAAGNLRAKGMERMRGPLSPSLNDEICFLYEGRDSFPNVMMPYNPVYYNHFARGYGMSKVKDFLSYWVNLERELPEDLVHLPRRAEQDGVVFRKFEMKHFSRDVELLRRLNNQSWLEARHWGFVPITEAEMGMMADHFRRLADPDIILFAEVGGEPAGYVLNLPNFFPGLRFLHGKPNPIGVLRFLNHLRHIRNVRAVSVGVLSKFARRNIALSLFVKSVLEMQRKGYASMEYVWVMEDNDASLRIVSRFGGRLYKRYRMYEVPLPENLHHVPAAL